MYSDLYLKKRNNIGFFVASGFLIIVVSIFTFFFFHNNPIPTRASKNTLVKHEIVNFSSQEVGVFWETNEEDLGWLIYGVDQNKLQETAVDEQDLNDSKTKHTLHYAILKKLRPSQTYYYKIVSNQEVIDNNSQPFTVKTSADSIEPVYSRPAYGKVILTNGEPAPNIFVMVRYKNTYPFLAITKSSGEWLITIRYGVDHDTLQTISLYDQEEVQIEIFNNQNKSDIRALVGQLSPLPKTVILGQNYRFLETVNDVLPASTKRGSGTTHRFEVQFPQNGAVIPRSVPLIKGRGIPSTDVSVEIDSAPKFASTVQVDAIGDWRVELNRIMLPGVYQLKVTGQNADGEPGYAIRHFTIAKSGEAVVLGEATDSAQLTVTPILTVTTFAVSPSPADIYVYDPTATPVPPTSGSSNYFSYILSGLGLLVFGIGIVLLF